MSVVLAEQTLPTQESPLTERFKFYSPHRNLLADGIAEHITTPASDKSDPRALRNTIQDAFRRAIANGISRPVLVGAIPFDLTQPSSLYIPQQARFINQSQKYRKSKQREPFTVVARRNFPEEGRYKQSVQQAIANFQLSDIRKAVLSRVLELQLSDELPAGLIFNSLRSQNPNGYHFSVPIDNRGQLVGVSPELLVRKENMKITSNPLAGSSKRREDQREDQAAAEALQNSKKDLYEHRLVIEEIDRVLRPLCVQLDTPESPSLLHTQTMWHLSTLIQGSLANSDTTALDLACQLHPTPAVCGYPTILAHKLINLVESFDRGLFAGMVGWQDSEGNGEWVVTIRCGIVRGNQINLFAGAGIVEDSCPESEWAETQAKMQTMLKALPFDVETIL